MNHLPVAIIGAGPVGLAAAIHLIARGETPLVLEAGDSVAANIREWSHVRMFSPWRYNVDPVAAGYLVEAGYSGPDPDSLPTGKDLFEQYLEPLANLPVLKPHIRLGVRVISVTRKGFDKVKTTGREDAPFVLRVRLSSGQEVEFLAKAVIDASGNFSQPNPMGASGVAAPGEREAVGRITYGIPDVLGVDRGRFAGKRVMVVGSGHSAMNSLITLARLQDVEPDTQVVWVIRRAGAQSTFGGETQDGLPARGQLGTDVRELIEQGRIHLEASFRIKQVRLGAAGVRVWGERNGREAALEEVDEIVVATGARPNLEMLREVRLDLDPALESPRALAPLIDPNVHSCGSVRPHGADLLQQPEKDFYIVGVKSYGRAPTFLLLVGYEQARSVVAAITGDLDGARSVQLTLPETGVCGATCCEVAHE